MLLVAPLAVGAYLYYPQLKSAAKGAPSGGTVSKKKGGKGGENATTPVIGARAVKGTIGVYFNGLGSVTPISTVAIKSRVDGELMAVNFREGDMVHKGDLLIQIDPRPYQVQLTQAEGQQMKDQATLENARVDLTRYEGLLKQNAIPEQQVANQRATVKEAEATVKSRPGSGR